MPEREQAVEPQSREEARERAEACVRLGAAMATGERSDQAAGLELADFAGGLAADVLALVEALEAAERRGDELEAKYLHIVRVRQPRWVPRFLYHWLCRELRDWELAAAAEAQFADIHGEKVARQRATLEKLQGKYETVKGDLRKRQEALAAAERERDELREALKWALDAESILFIRIEEIDGQHLDPEFHRLRSAGHAKARAALREHDSSGEGA